MADNYNIFFDIYPLDSKLSNSFALITGATGVGKSTLCKTLAERSMIYYILETTILAEKEEKICKTKKCFYPRERTLPKRQ